jgi:hypothetical protein
MAGPDPNIDHRRVPNLATYFSRVGARTWRAGPSPLDDGYMKLIAAGDILTWRSFVGGGTHIAIVSQTAGWPRLIQNYGWGVHEEVLNPAWMTGVDAAFRWRPNGAATRAA